MDQNKGRSAVVDDQPILMAVLAIMHEAIRAIKTNRMLLTNSRHLTAHLFAAVAIHRFFPIAPDFDFSLQTASDITSQRTVVKLLPELKLRSIWARDHCSSARCVLIAGSQVDFFTLEREGDLCAVRTCDSGFTSGIAASLNPGNDE